MTSSSLQTKSAVKDQPRGARRSIQNWLARLALAGFATLCWNAQAQTSEVAAGSKAQPEAAVSAPGPSQDSLRADALLERAIAHYKRMGDKALSDFTLRAEYTDGELYVFVVDTRGELLACGGPAAALVHQNLAEVEDALGKPFMAEILEKAHSKAAGTVTYNWLNRVDNKVEPKVTHFEKVGDRIIAVGYYVARATPAQAEALLRRASDALEAAPAKAIAAFNSLRGEYAEDDLYVFVIDLSDNRFVAHGIDRRLIGSDATKLRDAAGKPIAQLMKDVVAQKDRSEADYLWPNPVTGQVEHKHALLQKVGGLLVGVGYYQR